jgi:Tol biopolymer transport system component
VLFEILTGQMAFSGRSSPEILNKVLNAEPDWSKLPADVPAGVRTLLRRCLAKDRHHRLRDIADARFQLEDAAHDGAGAAVAASQIAQASRLGWWVAAVAGAGAIATLAIPNLQWRAPRPELRFQVATPPFSNDAIAVSPDGHNIAYQVTDETGTSLWVRQFDSVEARPLKGTDNGMYPFWSPDSRYLAFLATGSLKRIDLQSNIVETLASAHSGAAGGSWRPDGTILVGFQVGGGLKMLPPSAKALVPVAGLTDVSAAMPKFLPDGRHFIYHSGVPGTAFDAFIGSLDNSVAPRRLLTSEWSTEVTPSGNVLFIRGGRLMIQALDQQTFTLVGEATPVSDRAVMSVSVGGSTLAFRTGTDQARIQQYRWFDRTGRDFGSVGEPLVGQAMSNASLSRDGRRLALWPGRRSSTSEEIWTLDLDSNTMKQLTSAPSVENDPIWSWDGSEVAFTSTKNGVFEVFGVAATGAGPWRKLVGSEGAIEIAHDWSKDGRYLLYGETARDGVDIYARRMDSGERIVVAKTAANEKGGQFSPDVKWVAYQSTESGRYEIYIQAFPQPTGRVQVSSAGGVQARWSPDGKELYYIAPDRALMSVRLTAASGADISVGAPVKLFQTRITDLDIPNLQHQYMLSPDGKRFLINTAEAPPTPIGVILNWDAGR